MPKKPKIPKTHQSMPKNIIIKAKSKRFHLVFFQKHLQHFQSEGIFPNRLLFLLISLFFTFLRCLVLFWLLQCIGHFMLFQHQRSDFGQKIDKVVLFLLDLLLASINFVLQFWDLFDVKKGLPLDFTLESVNLTVEAFWHLDGLFCRNMPSSIKSVNRERGLSQLIDFKFTWPKIIKLIPQFRAPKTRTINPILLLTLTSLVSWILDILRLSIRLIETEDLIFPIHQLIQPILNLTFFF